MISGFDHARITDSAGDGGTAGRDVELRSSYDCLKRSQIDCDLRQTDRRRLNACTSVELPTWKLVGQYNDSPPPRPTVGRIYTQAEVTPQ